MEANNATISSAQIWVCRQYLRSHFAGQEKFSNPLYSSE